MTDGSLAARLDARIRHEYDARRKRHPEGAHLDWRLLYSPARVLSGARVAFLGTNPGGAAVDPDHGVFSCERGSAYRRDVENWGSSSRLQDQVMALFMRLDVVPEDVLAGNLVPFRSPDERSLINLPGAVNFGRSLWTEILQSARPEIVISMGRLANLEFSRLLDVRGARALPVGWGSLTALRGPFPGGTWIGLPHLSRFAIMNRAASRPALDVLLGGLGSR